VDDNLSTTLAKQEVTFPCCFVESLPKEFLTLDISCERDSVDRFENFAFIRPLRPCIIRLLIAEILIAMKEKRITE